MIGETLGSYTVVKRLGAGGMGEVYLAQHTRIDRQAAIKVLLPGLSSNQEVVDRFFAEARATSSIRHSGIVEVLDCNVHASGRAYIVMELLEGDSLAGRLARDAGFGRDLPRVLHVAGAVADAVGAAHAKGIVHRDLKPDNVFLANYPTASPTPAARFGFEVKILDFGIAKLMGTDAESGRPVSARTRTGSLLGTPAYMSPEQCRGASRVDHRTDIYSLGCIVYEMLAGRLPFVYAGFGELISAHLHETPPPLASLGVIVPGTVEAWLARLLAKAPEQRFATMAEVVAAVRALDGDAAPFVTPVVTLPAARATMPSVSHPATTFSGQAAEKLATSQSPRFKRVMVAIGLLAAAGIGAAVVVTRGGAPSPAAPAAVAVTSAPSPEVAQVTVSVSDAPEGLSVLLDGETRTLPVTLARGARVHELTFRAPGYQERVMRLDASTSRVVTLAMQPVAATPPPVVATPPAAAVAPAARPASPPPASRGEGKKRERRPRGTDAPALTDDARKL